MSKQFSNKNLIYNSKHILIKVYTKLDYKLYNYKIKRPVLEFSRFEFLKLCEFWNFPIYIDSTNCSSNFKRNRLRLQFIPYLKFFFNDKLLVKISQIQKIIDLENNYFQLITQKLFFKKNLKSDKKENIYYNFIYFPKIIQYRIIHNFYYLIKKKISFNEIYYTLKKINIRKK